MQGIHPYELCDTVFIKYHIFLLTRLIISNLHVIVDGMAADVVAAQQQNVKLAEYAKQLADGIDKISRNKAKESDDGILEQVHEHIAEFLKAVEAGKNGIAEFSSTKILVEELMQNHAKQPAQIFTRKGA